MEKQCVTFGIAYKLKQLGFDEECIGYFDEEYNFYEFSYYDYDRENSTISDDYGIKLCTTPLWQQAQDWLRSKKYYLFTNLYTPDGEFGYSFEIILYLNDTLHNLRNLDNSFATKYYGGIGVGRGIVFKTEREAFESGMLEVLNRVV